MTRPLIIAAALAVLSATVAATWLSFLMSVPVGIYPDVAIEVPSGQSPTTVAHRLEEEGVIRSARAFLTIIRFRGRDRQIRYGTHVFSGAMSPTQVLLELTRPPTDTVAVTIPEGLSWAEVGRLLEEAGITTAVQYEKAVCNPALVAMAKAVEGANCAEGYLFPDTYNLTPGMSALAIAHMQLKRFGQVMGELVGEAGLTEAGGDDYLQLIRQTVILASIVEKETSRADERSLVASVFHNRLARRMRLQADPTVIYGLVSSGQPYTGNLQRVHLQKPGPYNTYKLDGLPAGPISNPGREALTAVLKPQESDYLFFVARRDGTHAFSPTLAEHNRAVRKHQLR
ncbi:MAG: endolytic transglycosylase MltG [Deltaproteobacteria bacterium]